MRRRGHGTANVATGTVNVGTFVMPSGTLNVGTVTANMASGTFPRTPVITSYGQVNPGLPDRGSTGASNQGIYAFTLPTAHPSGTNSIVMVTHQTTSSSTTAPLGYISCNAAQSTLFNVWIRNSANTLQDGSFYVYTIP